MRPVGKLRKTCIQEDLALMGPVEHQAEDKIE